MFKCLKLYNNPDLLKFNIKKTVKKCYFSLNNPRVLYLIFFYVQKQLVLNILLKRSDPVFNVL
ncbi:MAG: hypothetical protein A2277_01080 [Desulfobacterales bacterium RIFOXYA12_FULL_46_15]|nr:MAG: hypothetical protein A2277_01080 [Desulfobacterales bacterium RIFOXYA12_FULL_46_15]